jgi:hypothetical protein
MDVVADEIGSYSETGVTCDDDDDGTEGVSIQVEDDVDINEEFSIKVEEAIDIKDEIPPMETEQEVRLWGACEVVAALVLKAFVAPKQIEITLNFVLLCVVFWKRYTFCNLHCKPQEMRLCGSHSH